MHSSTFVLVVSALSLLPYVDANAGSCPAIATSKPKPPAAQGLYPVRMLRADGRAADSSQRQEMFRVNQSSDGVPSKQVYFAPPVDPAMEMRREVRLASGHRVLQVIEEIPNNALTPLAVKNRRWAGEPHPKALTLEVVEGREYSIAARLIPDQANRTKANAHWEPVVWREQARDCH